ncbi:hypothetical protein CDV36_012700 [Fusarium kuroshium]|uniref:Ribonuclease H1 N-terminal domain-containing protein n=2 Tax=Fusarium solani species complex TaxID=232080 RepID=A0A3M2RQY1_9HYPO|nr:hypothetical protein CDV36_012700 [Fusarium kuroshium]RSL82171.1 hypothetical protein CEP51_005359 [Fusarium floridanum]
MTAERRSPRVGATGNRRRRFAHEPADRRWYGVRAGYQTGPIQGWQNCLRSTRGYEDAEFQRCLDRQDAQRWCDEGSNSRPTTPLRRTSRLSSPTGLFSNEASSSSIPASSSFGSGGLFSNETNSFSPSIGSSPNSGGSSSGGSSSGRSSSGRTGSPDLRILDDRLRSERNINILQGLLRNLHIGETVSITRGEGDLDFMYTIGSNPRSLE